MSFYPTRPPPTFHLEKLVLNQFRAGNEDIPLLDILPGLKHFQIISDIKPLFCAQRFKHPISSNIYTLLKSLEISITLKDLFNLCSENSVTFPMCTHFNLSIHHHTSTIYHGRESTFPFPKYEIPDNLSSVFPKMTVLSINRHRVTSLNPLSSVHTLKVLIFNANSIDSSAPTGQDVVTKFSSVRKLVISSTMPPTLYVSNHVVQSLLDTFPNLNAIVMATYMPNVMDFRNVPYCILDSQDMKDCELYSSSSTQNKILPYTPLTDLFSNGNSFYHRAKKVVCSTNCLSLLVCPDATNLHITKSSFQLLPRNLGIFLFPKLKKLKISSTIIVSLKDFHCPTLVSLEISQCDISSVSPIYLPNLQYLCLQYQLCGSHLPCFLCPDAPLRTIHLGDIDPDKLPLSQLQDGPQLFDLSYSTSIKSLTPLSNHFIQRIDLRHSSVESIDFESFSSLPNLLEVDLRESHCFTTLASFRSDSLLNLLLSKSNLVSTLPSFGKNLPKLENLDLSFTPHFETLSSIYGQRLYIVNLSHSSVKTIANGFGEFLPNLTELNLSYTTNLSEFPFLQSASLRELDLTFSGIKIMDDMCISECTRLKTLILNNTPLEELPNIHSSSLSSLTCQGSNIAEISPLFGTHVPLLDFLDLSLLSKLQSIPDFEAFNLTSLTLANSNVSSISASFLDLLPSLKVLNLDFIPLKFCPAFSSLSLLRLSMVHSDIRTIPNSFCSQLPFLQYLNLSGITELESTLSIQGKNLLILKLCHCSIPNIADNFGQFLPQLKTLDFGWSKIPSIPAIRGPELSHLILNNCEISHVDPSFGIHLPKLNTFEVSNVKESVIVSLFSHISLKSPIVDEPSSDIYPIIIYD